MNDRDERLWLKYSTVGLELAVIVFVFTCGGYYLGLKFGYMPLCTIAGAFSGMGIGFYNVYRSLTRDERGKSSENEKRTGKD